MSTCDEWPNCECVARKDCPHDKNVEINENSTPEECAEYISDAMIKEVKRQLNSTPSQGVGYQPTDKLDTSNPPRQSTPSPSKEEKLKKAILIIEKTEVTFGKLDNVFKALKEAEPEMLHGLVAAIDVDLPLIQAKIKDELSKTQATMKLIEMITITGAVLILLGIISVGVTEMYDISRVQQSEIEGLRKENKQLRDSLEKCKQTKL